MPRQARGFTLLELLITVAIVGLLAGVAYPSYQSQVRKSRRADAVQALVQLQQAQARWRANNAAYAANGVLASTWPGGLGLSATSVGGYYTLAISGTPTGTGYVATATAVSGKSQASDSGCTTLTLTVSNANTTNTPAPCWSR